LILPRLVENMPPVRADAEVADPVIGHTSHDGLTPAEFATRPAGHNQNGLYL